ncbi:hypothetical protein CULT_220061 [[Clostridium] ultunense Esp]|nr:hypothetical protein CULT_220061 [[Clostridium] ultunense Esp]
MPSRRIPKNDAFFPVALCGSDAADFSLGNGPLRPSPFFLKGVGGPLPDVRNNPTVQPDLSGIKTGHDDEDGEENHLRVGAGGTAEHESEVHHHAEEYRRCG